MAFVNLFSASAHPAPFLTPLELVCSVNSQVALRAAVDNGADWVRLDYCGYHNAAGLPGQNLGTGAIVQAIHYAHDRYCKVLLNIDAQAQSSGWATWREAIDLAAQCGVDAIALSDPALLLYASAQHSGLRLHYAVQDAALDSETIDFFRQRFGVSRILLPRVLTLAQVARIAANTSAELQVVGFGRCCSIITGDKGESGGAQHLPESSPCRAPDLCANTESAANDASFVPDGQPDARTLKLLPRLATLGISAIQVEAPLHGPALLAQVTRVWRAAVDECLENLDHYSVKPSWVAALNRAARASGKC